MDGDQTRYKIKDYDDDNRNNEDVVSDNNKSDKSESLNMKQSFEDLSVELKKTKDELEHYRKLYDNTINKLKYCLADFDNFRKNIEKQNTVKILSVKADMLSAMINFREDFVRALDSINQQKLDSSVSQGLKVILKNMDTYLEKENVKEIKALNSVFDPNFHEIVGFSYFGNKEEEEGIKENIVTKEIRKGYLLNDKILRPSMVEVSKKIIKNTDNDNKKDKLGDEV